MAIINLQLEIIIIVICGYILAKLDILNEDARKRLTDMIIYLILPCSIIKSFAMQITSDILVSTIEIFVISFAIQLSYSILNRLLYNQFDESKAIIMKYGTIVSNASFMGYPIVESVFGSVGLLYASVALIPLRLFMWSVGLSLFTTTQKKDAIKKVMTHPCMIAIYIGIIVMILESLNIMLPDFFIDSITAIGNCTTALSMIVIGAILVDIDFHTLLDKSCLYFSLIRLIAIPIIIYIILTILSIDKTVTGVITLLSAMPAAFNTAMLAQKYDVSVHYASKLVIVSTILSLVTLPLISILIR